MWKAEESCLFPVCFNKKKSGTGSSIFFAGVFNKIMIPIANVGYDCGEVAVRRCPNVTGADGRKDGLKNQLLEFLVRL